MKLIDLLKKQREELEKFHTVMRFSDLDSFFERSQSEILSSLQEDIEGMSGGSTYNNLSGLIRKADVIELIKSAKEHE